MTHHLGWQDVDDESSSPMTGHEEATDMTTSTTIPDVAQLSGSYTIDPAHSRIGFVARHAMVAKVRGSFDEFEGSAVLDGANPAASTATVTIQATSINTRNDQRDAHLRSNDFLALDEYPQITFVSTGANHVSDS